MKRLTMYIIVAIFCVVNITVAQETEFLPASNPIETQEINTLLITTGVSLSSDLLFDFNLMPTTNVILDDYMEWYQADVSAFTLSMMYGTAKSAIFGQTYNKHDLFRDLSMTISTRVFQTVITHVFR